jgi:hypothetical protein
MLRLADMGCFRGQPVFHRKRELPFLYLTSHRIRAIFLKNLFGTRLPRPAIVGPVNRITGLVMHFEVRLTRFSPDDQLDGPFSEP